MIQNPCQKQKDEGIFCDFAFVFMNNKDIGIRDATERKFMVEKRPERPKTLIKHKESPHTEL